MTAPDAPTIVVGLDGLKRSAPLEETINDLFLGVFTGPAGEQVLQYLKNITLHRTTPPGVRSEDLHAAEGERRLVALIITRIEHGRKQRSQRAAAGSDAGRTA